MEKWIFTKLENNEKYAGIITATTPETKDAEMLELFGDLEFERCDTKKMILIDRYMIRVTDDERFYNVNIDEMGRPLWNNPTCCKYDINPRYDVVEEADFILQSNTDMVSDLDLSLSEDDLDFDTEDTELEQ